MPESEESPAAPQDTGTQDAEIPTAAYTVKVGCLEAQLNEGKCLVIKKDESCSCPTDLSTPFSQADALKLSNLLHKIGSARPQ